MIGLDCAVVAGVSISPIEDIIPGPCAARTYRDDDDIQVNYPTGCELVKDQGWEGGWSTDVINYSFEARNGDRGPIRRPWGQE